MQGAVLIRQSPSEMRQMLLTEGDIVLCQIQVCDMQMGSVGRESMKEELSSSRR